MKKVLSLNNVLFVVESLAFVTTLLLLVTQFSFAAVIVTAVFVVWIATIPFLFLWNEKLEARWPWMKSTWFVLTYRTLSLCVIAYCLYVMFT